jgi:streptogramin lyase
VGTAGAAGAAGSGGTVMPRAGGAAGTALPLGGSMGMQDAGVGGKPSEGGGASGHGSGGGGGGTAGGSSGTYNHRVLLGSGLGPIAIVTDDGQFEWQIEYKPLGRPGAETEGNDAVLLPNGDIAFTFSAGAEEVKPDKTVVWRFDNPSGTETQGITPLPDGHFMVGETHSGGVAYLRELDAMGKVVNSITVTSGTGLSPHQQFREIRKTPQGTYLVTYLGLEQAREIDATGKTLRKFPCGSFVAVRLPQGNTLISCGNTHRVIEVDTQDKIVWEANKTNVPLMNGFAAGIQRLPNGNTAMCSFPGDLPSDPKTTRCFEVTPDFKVVWQLKTPKTPDYYWTALELLDPRAQVGGVPLR